MENQELQNLGRKVEQALASMDLAKDTIIGVIQHCFMKIENLEAEVKRLKSKVSEEENG